MLKQEEDATEVDLRMALRDAVSEGGSALERVKAALIDTGREIERSLKAAEAMERRNVSSARQTYEWAKRLRVDALWMCDHCVPPEQVATGILHPRSGVRALIHHSNSAMS